LTRNRQEQADMDDSHDHDAPLTENVSDGPADPAISLFDDGKEPQALRTIGEVAKVFGLRAHVLRYWEEQFPALEPIKRSGNRRYYRPEDVALIAEIDRLVHREGYTLRGAAKMMADKALPEAASENIAPAPRPHDSGDADFLRKLSVIRGDLARALERA
jgi:DNA-binding transcriptional MerR regulator